MANEIFRMNATELAKVKSEVDQINKSINSRRTSNNDMDRDAFLRLLTIQLSHQDPLSPMKNTEFIAQMAQFTALEQMKNVSEAVGQLRDQNSRSTLLNLIGSEINYRRGEDAVRVGVVEKVVLLGDEAQLYANGERVAMSEVISVEKNRQEMPVPVASNVQKKEEALEKEIVKVPEGTQ